MSLATAAVGRKVTFCLGFIYIRANAQGEKKPAHKAPAVMKLS
jgi:hypothetical protein